MQEDDERYIEFGTLSEQTDEASHDNRLYADDDLVKGRIVFPTGRLYGRENELQKLHEIFSSMIHGKNEGSIGTSQTVFLGGLSGSGKSALIDEFLKQTVESHCNKRCMQGKFSQMKTGDPFSALSQALNQFAMDLVEVSNQEELETLRNRLEKVEISLGSDDSIVLVDTLMPALENILNKSVGAQSSTLPTVPATCSSLSHDLNAVSLALQNFLQAIATETSPLIFFIDDLQWADQASSHVLMNFLKNRCLNHVMFIAAYRSNEVDEEHSFSKLMKEVEKVKGSRCTHFIELSNLSPVSVAEFIADSIDRIPEEITPIAEAVYTKTLGNIFFVKQAVEELVRRNALYYDMVCFQWQFGDVSRVELESFLSDDVLLMVQSKLRTMPYPIPKVLALAAYTKNTIELDLLADLLRAEDIQLESTALRIMVNKAYQEGLVLLFNQMKSFKFAHDKIREAACALVPSGKERNKFLLRLSMVLKERGSLPKDDWMLFTAALHLNAISKTLTDPIDIATLNLRVGLIAIHKGAFNEAVTFLRAGNERLEPGICWKDHYNLSLELKNNLTETEHFLGNEDNALALAEEIMKNAHSLVQKTRAHYAYIQSTCAKNNNNYELSVETGLKILEQYQIFLPLSPNDQDAKRSKLRLKIALRCRSLLSCSKFPMATDELFIAQCKIAQIISNHAFFAKNYNLSVILGNKMLRLALEKQSITKDLPYLVVCLGAPSVQKEKYDEASAYANIGISLMDRFPGEKSLEFLKAKIAMFSILTCLRLPFRDAIETFLDLNKSLLAKGETDLGLGAGMVAIYCFYNASLPLNSLFDPKLILFEEMASVYGRKSFVVIFSLFRQCLYNLQGKKSSPIPTEVQGEAFRENIVMAECEGKPKDMNNRDIATVRLMLAVIFYDESAMDEMLVRLDGYPVHDPPIMRQHFRMVYMGFASLILSRKLDKYKKWAVRALKFYEKLSKFGSPNAQPVFSCMSALKKFNVAAFDEAIDVCGSAGLLNLTALMNEHCGLMLLEQNKHNDNYTKAVNYLKCAIWLYHDWGAAAKVSQLQAKFEFLQSAIQDKPPSQLSSVRRSAVLLGVHRKSVAIADQPS